MVKESISFELLDNTKPIDLFNDLKTFNYDNVATINDIIVNAYPTAKMISLWAYNNHNQPLCLTPSWLIAGDKGIAKISVKFFRDDYLEVFINLRDHKNNTVKTVCSTRVVYNTTQVIATLLYNHVEVLKHING